MKKAKLERYNMKLSKREKIMIAILCVILIGFVYFKFLFLPEGDTINKLKAESLIKSGLVDQTKNNDSKLSELKSQIADIDEKLQQSKGDVEKPLHVPELILEFNDIAKSHNVTINNIEFSSDAAAIKGKFDGDVIVSTPAATLSNIKTLTITVAFTAKYSDFIDFQTKFEQNKRFFMTNSLKLTKGKKYFTGTLVLSTFSVVSDEQTFKYELSKGTTYN